MKRLDISAESYAKKKAAKEVNPKEFNDYMLHHSFTGIDLVEAFKAGAEWQQKQNQKQYEKECSDFINKGIVSAKGMAVSLAYEKGKSDMKQEMLKSAKPGTAQKDYQLILDDGTYIDLDPSMSLNPAVKVKEGQRLLVSIITEQ